MINTTRAGTGDMNVVDEVIEAFPSDDKDFKTWVIKLMGGVTFPILE